MAIQQILAAYGAAGGGGGGGPGTHRYWRVNVTANDGSASFIGFTEIELRGTVGGADLTVPQAPGAAATASSEINGSNAPHLAVDNNPGAGWLSSTPATSWWKYDFGNVGHTGNPTEEILQIQITGSFNAPSASPKDFTLQWSDDDASWTTALTVTGQTGWTGASDVRTFNV